VAIHPSLTPDAVAAMPASVALSPGAAEIGGLPAAPRHFFHWQVGERTLLVVADRHVALQGARNFRDFGGYTTADGRRVRWGCLYRSGQLGALTAADQQQVADLGIGLICDFRRDSERAQEPNLFAAHHRPRIENLPIAPGNTSSVLMALDTGTGPGLDSIERIVQCMVDINRDLALCQRAAYRRMFDALLAVDGPLLVHCAAGKDRTGFAALLILAALGVPEETIIRDYLLTSRYLPARQELTRMLKRHSLGTGPESELLLPLLEAREIYLQGALQAIREQYGDIDNYLRDYLAIDDNTRRELRARLLVAV
jgi:protein-tyrosine phosphatase